jgi:outer membrane usher protein
LQTVSAFEPNSELVEIEVVIRFNNVPIGEASIKVKGNDEFISIKRSDVLGFSKKYFSKRKHQELENFKSDNGFILKEFLCLNIKKCYFNTESLELELEIDLNDFQAKDLSLRAVNFQKDVNRKLAPPAEVSGFLTHRTTFQTNHGQGAGRIFSQLNSALTIHKGTIESSYFYQNTNEKKFQRINTLFTHDMDKKHTRLQAGDFNFRTNSFMNGMQVGGVRYSRDFSLSPRTINQPLNEYEFLVQRKSDVNIYINDRLFQTTVLAPGKYNVKDLPLNLGLNNIRIELIDESGYTETLFFPYIVDQELLEIGRSDFSYEMGVRSQTDDQDIVYNKNKEGLIGSFFHRRGITKKWTPGAFAQVSEDQQVIGADSVYGAKFGLLRFETAASLSPDLDSGYTARLTYLMRNFNLGTSSNREIRFRYQYEDPNFVRFGNSVPNNIYQNQFNVSYRERLIKQLSMTLSTNYLVANKAGFQDRQAYSINFYHIPNTKLSHNLTLTRSNDREGLWESSVLYFLNYNFGDRKHTATGYHNSSIENSRLALRGRYQTETSLVNTDLDTVQGETSKTYNARLRMRHNRFQVEALHRATDNEGKAKLGHQSNVTLSNSVSFADKVFALSDPIGNSFMLVQTDEELKGSRVDINGGGAYSAPSSDDLGPAVMTNLTPYQISRIAMDTTELPEGLSLRQHTFYSKLRYKAGTLIRVKAKGTAAAYGRLLRPDGTAFGLQFFEFVNKEDAQDRIESFTNDIGELESETNLTYEIEIRKGQHGLLELGKLRMKVKE